MLSNASKTAARRVAVVGTSPAAVAALGRRTVVTDPSPNTVSNPAINQAADRLDQILDQHPARSRAFRHPGRGRLHPPASSRRSRSHDDRYRSRSGEQQDSGPGQDWKGTAFKMTESALTTGASIAVLGLVGFSYTQWYKYHVVEKMEGAFKPGDPMLELATASKHGYDHSADHWVQRPEQAIIDDIVAGKDVGSYHLLIGEKGTGKSSMLLDAMSKIDGEGCAFFEAHSDPEIFRVRLGKALDFEFHEDNIGSLFSIRGPRDASAMLDVERAFNKLEKVAMKRRRECGKPLIIIINSVHLLRDDDAGRGLLELLEQRAEMWAASRLCTVIMNSDDYWVYERLKNLASRMRVTSLGDLNKDKAMEAFGRYRKRYFNESVDADIFDRIFDSIGGRLSFLARVARSDDMLGTCEAINQAERTWLLNKCWVLGTEMDDDVMDQQKYASSAMVLAKALVDREKAELAAAAEGAGDDAVVAAPRPSTGHQMPHYALHEANEIMTRVDFIQSYDHDNIFHIDSHANVRADSVPMMNAFRYVCAQPGFERHLERTLVRIADIESLGRTRELTIKDLWHGGQYVKKQTVTQTNGQRELTTVMSVIAGDRGDDDDDDDADDK